MEKNERASDLSVVIATLGGSSLSGTLNILNIGSVRPAEILICIPESEAKQLDIDLPENAEIVATAVRGQVAQRAVGLTLARGRYVMQMDDDVHLEEESLRRLLDALEKLGPGHVVAPLYKHLADKSYITKYHSGLRGWITSLEAMLLCSAPWGIRRMGKLTRLGIGYWVDPRYLLADSFEVEWLPGGCVICAREDLVLDCFYPLAGKAYTEDVVHSIKWRQQGCRLWAVVTASCCTEVAPLVMTGREIFSNFRARMYVANLLRGNKLRLTAWFVLYLSRQLLTEFRVRMKQGFSK